MNKIFLLFLFLILPFCLGEEIFDEIAQNLPNDIEKPYIHNAYNYSSCEKIPLKINVAKKIKSEKDLFEGQTIKFYTKTNLLYKNNVIIPKRTEVLADVKTIITSGMNGIPASIIFGNIRINNIKKGQLSQSFEIFGQDRSLFVFPLKWALTPLPPTGSLTNFIKGGHAKLSENKTITIYFYPEWK